MMVFKILYRHARQRLLLSGTAGAAVLLLTSCATPETGVIPQPLYQQPDSSAVGISGNAVAATAASQTRVDANPLPPTAARLSTVKAAAPADGKQEKADITLTFDQIPLPTFIQAVFGTILKKNFSIDPQVGSKQDLVTLRTGSPQTPSQTLDTARMLLKSYGVAVTEMGGYYRITLDNNLNAYAPEIRRGRAQPEVPLPLRPVFNLVELTSVRSSDVSIWLKTMFGQKITVQDDNPRNALLISGQSADITAALEAIQVLDQPLMRGRGSRRIAPGFVSVEELARKLIEILTAEGYAAATNATVNVPITLIPIAATNSLLVFAGDPAVLDHVVAWAKQLDASASNNKGSGGYLTYPVKYADAQDLAKTLQDLLSSAASTATTPAAAGTPAAAVRKTGRIVVNGATNTLIFQSTPDEYTQMLGILKELDQPAKSALIEVTVAEVSVGDKNQFGIEWGLNPINSHNGTIVGGTQGGVGIGTGGLTLNFLNSAGQIKATLNALANNNRANIISTPRIMARNGETATIEVGQEVPIITTQQSNANTTIAGSTGGILQTVQYRTTGVILKVKPVIHAGNRVELEVSQEVSAAASTTTGVNTSPTFSKRKVETKLSIRDGATVLLGGLMSTNSSDNDTGVPYLKDIPGVGNLFKSNKRSNDKTELIVLITPYVIDDDLVAEQVTQAFRDQIGPWAQNAPVIPGTVLKPKIVAPAKETSTPPAIEQAAPPMPAMPPTAPANPPEVPAIPPADNAPPAVIMSAPPAAPPGSIGNGESVIDPAILEELRKAAAGQNKPVKPAPKKP
ncbi:secretin N-terminal domain-containing protein [Herminiimonas sp. CN]|uniref:secretin N-terminal domain-containing protein n=1 Tax=Herminiimonas sp. CN TaxID=1349818 RepID=UPI000473B290|nr:secretin N-terminal domain-containing protein [Herminiimonas sp. CN]